MSEELIERSAKRLSTSFRRPPSILHYPTKKDADFLDPESHLDVLVEKGRASRLREVEGERTTPQREGLMDKRREKEEE